MSENVKKITNLEYFIETTRETKDAFGNRTRNKVTVKLKHKVNELSSDWRLVHYLLDIGFIKIILTTLYFFLGYIDLQDISISNFFFGNYDAYFIITFLLYYFITETIFQKSIGKVITKSIVVDEYGLKPKPFAMVFRTFGRLVPFDGLAIFLGYRALHDLASSTFVIPVEELVVLRKLQHDELNKLN